MRDIKNNIEILNKNLCTGCGVCRNICPRDAIEFEENHEGFLYPSVNDKCIDCGLCVKRCPMLGETEFAGSPDCYAVMGSKNLRMHSSSGGMFSIVAQKVLDNGGYVYGAAWDSPFTVSHKLVDSNDGLEELRLSKYVQSDTKNSYAEVKNLLSAGRTVFFTGCPCQIDGLYHYLGGRDIPGLLTADLICHGVPSSLTLRAYCDAISADKQVKYINFRSKEVYKWSTTMTIEYTDGSIYRRGYNEDLWYNCFAKNVFFRESCYSCRYAQIPRVGDFTFGDFWQIWKYDRDFDDGYGTSLVLANTPAAKKYIEGFDHLCKIKKENINDARKYNTQLNAPSVRSEYRDRFFEMLPYTGFIKAANYVVKGYADVGIFGYWYATNYGSVITYYALYKVIEKMGLVPMLIDRPEKERDPEPQTVFSRRFLEKNCNISISPKWSEFEKINDLCDTFVVGSDQVWTRDAIRLMGYYFFLSFITEDKKKIAYACSFGKDKFDVLPSTRRRVRYYLDKFDAVSVREDSGVDILRDTLHIKGTQVLDPIFLLTADEYAKIAECATQKENEAYVLAYILDPNDEKRRALQYISKRLGKKLVIILDGRYNTFENNKAKLALDNVKSDVMMEDWINYFQHADFVITDSHHGLAMAIIFNKLFVCINNPARGSTRFTSLLTMLGAMDRLILANQINEDRLYVPIDYKRINNVLAQRKERAIKWLHDALFKEKDVVPSSYDIIMEEIRDLKRKVEAILRKI